MKRKIFIALGLSLMTLNVSADETLRSEVGVKLFESDNIENAMQLEIKYQTDKGGYVYANYYKEDSVCEQSAKNISCIDDVYHDLSTDADKYIVHNYKGRNIEFGIGVSESWKNKSFNAEFYIGAGFYMNDGETYSKNYEIGNPVKLSQSAKVKFDNRGLAYHAGANLHPFSDNFTINIELSNNGNNDISKDVFYGDFYPNENIISYGLSYQYNNFTFEVEHSDNHVLGFGIKAKF